MDSTYPFKKLQPMPHHTSHQNDLTESSNYPYIDLQGAKRLGSTASERERERERELRREGEKSLLAYVKGVDPYLK